MNCTNAQLAKVARHVMEEAAFMFAELAECIESPKCELRAWLSLGSPLACRIQVETSRILAVAIAANFLGRELNDFEANIRASDALGELLNLVAGVLVLELVGMDEPCRIGVPRVALHPATPADVNGNDINVWLKIDEQPMKLSLKSGVED